MNNFKELNAKNTREAGMHAEQQAKAFLMAQGLKFIVANYRCKIGEIDLIFGDGEELVFVEVRWHHYCGYGDSLSSITYAKQCKIIKVAKVYLLQNKIFDKVSCRFDVIALSSQGKLEWIKDAFREE